MHHASLLDLQTFELVFPEHANPQGAAFGGFVLGLMDKVGSYAAAKFSQGPVVTVAVGEVEFKVPIRVGDLLEVKAMVTGHGKSSVQVAVQVWREKFGGQADQSGALAAPILATEGKLTFVSIDSDGHPTPIPSKS